MPFIYAFTDTRWSAAGTTYNGINLDVNNGAGGSAVGAAASRLLKFTNNTAEVFGVNLSGQIIAGTLPFTGLVTKPGIVVLGKLTGALMDVTTDQPITITSPTSKYRVQNLIAMNASAALGAAAGGLYTAAAKAGTAIIAAATTYNIDATGTAASGGASGAGTFLDQTTNATLYFSLTVAGNAGTTCDIYVIGVPAV